MIKDFKIDTFSKPVSALADTPKMGAAELKAWFDSNTTEEVKESINGLIDALADEGAFEIAFDESYSVGQKIEAIYLALAGKVDKAAGMGLSANDYTTPEKDKLAGIATGATANDTDANLKNRANHTGTQATSTVDGLQGALEQFHAEIETLQLNTSNLDNTADLDKPVSTATGLALAGKVDKVSGMGLSKNDYTDEEKGKLSAIPADVIGQAAADLRYASVLTESFNGAAVRVLDISDRDPYVKVGYADGKFVRSGKNLYNGGGWVLGTLNTSTGAEGGASTRVRSGFFPIPPYNEIGGAAKLVKSSLLSLSGTYFYDASQNFISVSSDNPVTVPANARYARQVLQAESNQTDTQARFQIELGGAATNYQAPVPSVIEEGNIENDPPVEFAVLTSEDLWFLWYNVDYGVMRFIGNYYKSTTKAYKRLEAAIVALGGI